MSGNIGNLGAVLTLDVKPFAEGAKTALKIAETLNTALANALKVKPTASFSKIDAEVKKLDATLDKYQTELKQTEAAQERVVVSTNKVAAAKTAFSGKLLNVTLALNYVRQAYHLLVGGLTVVTDAYNKQDVALAKLKNGLKNVGEGVDSFNKLVKDASAQQLVTPFADESIIDAQATLTTFQKTGAEIQTLIPRVLDLAAARMQDGDAQVNLSDVARVLGKVNEENLMVLRRYGIVISDTDEKMLKSLTGIKQAEYLGGLIDKRFKGMAETVGSTFAGKWAIFKNQIGEIFEMIGGFVAGVGSKFVDFFMSLIPTIQAAGEKIFLFYKELIQMIAGVIGGDKAASSFKDTIIKLITEGVDWLLSKMRELLPYFVSFVKAIKDWVSVNAPLLSDLKQIGKAIYEVSFFLAKVNISIITALINALSWLSKKIWEVKKLVMDISNSTLGKILMPGLSIGTGQDSFSNVTDEGDTFMKPWGQTKTETKKESLVKSPGTGSKEKEAEKNALDELLKKIREEITNAEYKNKLTKEFLQDKLALLEISKLDLKTIEEENKVYALRKDIQKQIFEMTKMKLGDSKMIIEVDISEELKKHLEYFAQYIKKLEDKAKEKADKIARMYGEINDILSGSLSIIDALGAKLTGAGKTFLQYISMALKLAQAAVNLAQKGSSEEGMGLGDVLGFIGSIIPFFLSEGIDSVPGIGSGDTVPAMLTPGEAVIKEPRVRALKSQFGSGFISWLNGGGSVASIAGHYNSGGVVTAALSGAGGYNVLLNGRPVTKAMKQEFYKDGLLLESLSLARKGLN